MPLPVPGILGHSGRPRDPRAPGSRRRHAAGAPRRGAGAPSTRRSIARRWRSSSCCSGAAPSWPRPAYPPYGIAFDVEKLTWELDFFVQHFLEAYRGRGDSGADARGARGGVAAIADELARAARALPSRLSQPQPDAARRRACYIIDFQDARMGPDTYDLVSLLRDSYVDLTRVSGRRADRLLPGAQAKGTPASPTAARVPPPLRPDGAAAQPESARHVRLPDDDAAEPRLHPVHSRARCATSRTNLERYPRFARLRELLGGHLERTAVTRLADLLDRLTC